MITAVGVDAAFANMGLVKVELHCLEPQTAAMVKGAGIFPQEFRLLSTTRQNKKEVRKSSDELRRAIELREGLVEFCQGAQMVFVEVPTGSLSAAAARSLGIAVGVLASCPVPIVEVSPMEVKRAVNPNMRGQKAPSKKEVIDWAVKLWPKAPWLRAHSKPTGALVNDNEHLADAMAAVVAGLSTPAFRQLMTLLNHATPGSSGIRSTLHSKPRRRLQMGRMALDP